jgi:hypothetical protein
MLKKLEELKGGEFTLLEMEAAVGNIMNIETDGRNSLFDGETEEFIKNGEYAYSYEDGEVNVKFTVLEKDDDLFETLVKVDDIEEL